MRQRNNCELINGLILKSINGKLDKESVGSKQE